jgi:hypothetical protein
MAASTMNVQEFDNALGELETRVDRLRALYENWFRGYEKMEPMVARKDVERRVYGLRKELPRNTALRFRYHQLYQRYTTLASYWQRTARQIEEGTYRLQLQRIKRRKVEDPLGRTLVPRRAEEERASLPSYELDLDESLDVNKLLDELDLEQLGRAIDNARPHSAPAGSSGPKSPVTAVRAATRFPRPMTALDDPTARPSGRPTLPPDVRSRPLSTPMSSQPSLSADVRALPPAPSGAARASLPPPAAAARASLPPPSAAGRPTLPAKARALPPPPPLPSGVARPSLPTASRPLPPQASPPQPAAAAPPGQRLAGLKGAPPLPRPPAPLAQAPAPAPRSPEPANQPPVAGLSEPQMRRIYDAYASARRKNNEADVRYETLAHSIQKLLPELNKKHQGKQIDFEVVLKDGRVGLKPKAH